MKETAKKAKDPFPLQVTHQNLKHHDETTLGPIVDQDNKNEKVRQIRPTTKDLASKK